MKENKLIKGFIDMYQRDLKRLERVFKAISDIENSTLKSKFESIITEEAIRMTEIIKRMKNVIKDAVDEESVK